MSTRSKTRDQSKAKPAKKAEDAIVLVEEPVIEDTAMAGSVLKLDSGDSHVFVHRTKFERLKEDFEAFVENFKSPAETPSCPMASSCSTCSTLREENKALKSTNEDLQREISNLREENKSLITVLRILNSPLKLKTQAVISSGTQVATLLHGIKSNQRGQERVLIYLPNLPPTKVLKSLPNFPPTKVHLLLPNPQERNRSLLPVIQSLNTSKAEK